MALLEIIDLLRVFVVGVFFYIFIAAHCSDILEGCFWAVVTLVFLASMAPRLTSVRTGIIQGGPKNGYPVLFLG